MMPLAFKPVPPAYGTIGETFNNTKFRGKAASAAIGIDRADAGKVIEAIMAINSQNPFPGALALRFVKGSEALLGFTKFPATCVLEMDGVDSKISREFFQKAWNRLEELNIPYTLHWGKFNFILNKDRVLNMYGKQAFDKWIECRNNLLDAETQKVFSNGFMTQCGFI